MDYTHDFAVFIGRLQPFHIGHYHVALESLKIAKKLIFVIGSHDSPRTPKNPFTSYERMAIIEKAMRGYLDRIEFHFQTDHTYNEDRWLASIQSSVNSIAMRNWSPDPIRIALVGYDKDHSSFYLKKFPHWDLIQIQPLYNASATLVRQCLLFDSSRLPTENFHINEDHLERILKYWQPIEDAMKKEWKIICDYRSSWSHSPYPPTFMTVDAVVTQSGHLLLVRRKAAPGEGLWALPGGFVNVTETLREAVLRELEEETKIKVPRPVLNGSIISQRTFDDPDRSMRGRTITEAFHFKLNDMEQLPYIKGSDDADKARWVPYNEVVKMRSMMFEDHYSMIEAMLGI